MSPRVIRQNNKRKQQKLEEDSSEKETIEDIFINLEKEKKRNRTRTNNRGPPLLSAIPFEAIPPNDLEGHLRVHVPAPWLSIMKPGKESGRYSAVDY